MDRRTTYRALFTLSLTGIAGLPANTNAAEERIGVAAVVRNTVSQLEPQVTRIARGDDVVRNEVVRTAADSDARFVFRDDTNLSLGPGSTMKLDRTVFDDPKAGDIAIKLTLGAFRFVTGHSNKEAYEIKTPIATMGVRGTTLDILVQRRRNTVVLAAGKATVCVPGKCVDLIHEGDSVNITSDGRNVSVDIQNGSTWNFDGECNGGLCGTSTFAEAAQNTQTAAAAGGGGGGPTAPGSFPTGGGGGGGASGSSSQGTASVGGGSATGGGVGGGGGGTSGGGVLTGANSSTSTGVATPNSAAQNQ